MLTKWKSLLGRSRQRFGIALAFGLLGSPLYSNHAAAQVTVRPEVPNYQSRFGDGTTRQKPVSRGTRGVASTNTRRSFDAPIAEASNREYEFAELQREADALERHYSLIRRIVRFTSPSIVHIEATKAADPGQGFASSKVEEAGAGIIISIRDQAYVLTNRHVIYPADLRSIRLELNNGQVLSPSKVWTDPTTDVALIRVENSGLVPAVIGDSDRLDVGDFVVAVGSPFGLSHSVTYGIISAKGRRNLELGSREIEIQDFFQTDAAINPGNSGGPLINLRGEIVGINTAIASNSGGNEGIGFSIPINMAVLVADKLVRQGQLSRSFLGVDLDFEFDIYKARRLGLNSNDGALVKSIHPGSPAATAGFQLGDVIVEFNGVRIENDGHLVKQVGLTPVGSNVSVIIYRDGRARRLSTVLQSNPF
ncbi:MAG: S1C family serine protease [Pirellulaceae bacterium]